MLSCAVVLVRRLPWNRLGLLVAASLVMGVGITLLVRARLGLVPMDVAHLGVARRFGWTLGGGIIATQSFLLITMTFLRIPVGIGTVLAFAVPAVTADVLLSVLPDITTLAWRIVALTTGGVACCVGVPAYLLADLGRMPRDGIMLALAAGRSGGHAGRAPPSPWRTACARVGIDLPFVLAGGLLLGPGNAVRSGAVGVATLVLACGSGPLVAWLLDQFAGMSWIHSGHIHGSGQDRPVRAKEQNEALGN